MAETINYNNAGAGEYVALHTHVNWDFSTSFSLKIGTTKREFTVRCAEQNVIPIWATSQSAKDDECWYSYEDDLHKLAMELFNDGEWGFGEIFGNWTTAKEAFDAAQVLKAAFKKYLREKNITHTRPRKYYVQDQWENNNAVGI